MPARKSDRRWTAESETASDSGFSENSDYSHITAPTECSHDSRLPAVKYQYHTRAAPSYTGKPWLAAPEHAPRELDPRASADTYASTVPSEDDLDEEIPAFDVPPELTENVPTGAIPSSPPDFALYFPSKRRLQIKHDDSTLDGNMNLRVDTEVAAPDGRRVDVTLFHLRMHDLRNREFSLRRYCRDSGREVCHSSRKYTKTGAARTPGLQRSMSNALSSLRAKSDSKSGTKTTLKRSDSGYGSLFEEDLDSDARRASPKGGSSIPLPTNTTHLEFSNYAHIDLKRRGAKASKRYEFEYWGVSYAWKRLESKVGRVKEVSYHLVAAGSSRTIAHIVPDVLTDAELAMEDAKGGWVPPCTLWISDDHTARGPTDVAE
jgi:hypothetical protein